MIDDEKDRIQGIVEETKFFFNQLKELAAMKGETYPVAQLLLEMTLCSSESEAREKAGDIIAEIRQLHSDKLLSNSSAEQLSALTEVALEVVLVSIEIFGTTSEIPNKGAMH